MAEDYTPDEEIVYAREGDPEFELPFSLALQNSLQGVLEMLSTFSNIPLESVGEVPDSPQELDQWGIALASLGIQMAESTYHHDPTVWHPSLMGIQPRAYSSDGSAVERVLVGVTLAHIQWDGQNVCAKVPTINVTFRLTEKSKYFLAVISVENESQETSQLVSMGEDFTGDEECHLFAKAKQCAEQDVHFAQLLMHMLDSMIRFFSQEEQGEQYFLREWASKLEAVAGKRQAKAVVMNPSDSKYGNLEDMPIAGRA